MWPNTQGRVYLLEPCCHFCRGHCQVLGRRDLNSAATERATESAMRESQAGRKSKSVRSEEAWGGTWTSVRSARRSGGQEVSRGWGLQPPDLLQVLFKQLLGVLRKRKAQRKIVAF